MSDDRSFSWAVAVLGWATVAFLVAPVLLTVLVSFNGSFFIEVPPKSYSFEWYRNISAINKIGQATLISFSIALAAGIIVTVLGLLAALAIVRTPFPGKAAVTAFMLSPVTVPIVAIGIALVQFFIRLDIAFTWVSLLIGHVVLVAAYPVRTVVASLTLSNPRIEEAAQSLGANPLTTFFTVTLPQLKPGLISGFLFAFLISFDNYPISIFLVRGGITTMPIEVFNYINQNLDPTPAAFSTLYIVAVTLVIWVVERRYRVISLALGGK